MSNSVILLRYGEIALKGSNKKKFEERLILDIHYHVDKIGEFSINKTQSIIYVRGEEEKLKKAYKLLKNVFGIATLSFARQTSKNIEAMSALALEVVKLNLNEKKICTFKVATVREDKKFEMSSLSISKIIGEKIIQFTNLKAQMENPDLIVYVEVRDFCYIHTSRDDGAKGLPSNGGIGGALISGGFDSPVACYMMSKRGMQIHAIHFHSHPYTSDKSKNKVIEIVEKLRLYCINLKLYVVPFTDVQISIIENSKKDHLTILMRRQMMKIAEDITVKNRGQALITGESLGQVASQTIEGLISTNDSASLIVLRPLIGMDKEEIMTIAKKIGTYDISKEPYEDCCTIFVPKHPVTKPLLKDVIQLEQALYNKTSILDQMKAAILAIEEY